MRIISFAWTSPAVLIARHPDPAISELAKGCTRREWDADYVRRIKAGDYFQAWTRSPRVHGQQFGVVKLTAEPELTSALPDADFRLEGFDYLGMRGIQTLGMAESRMNGISPRGLWSLWERTAPEDRMLWVVRFELVELTLLGEELLRVEIEACAAIPQSML